MRGEDGRRGSLEIEGKTLDGRILIKVCRSQIELIALIEAIGKQLEGDRIETVF